MNYYLDQEKLEDENLDLITYEESEKRLFVVCTIVALIFAIFNSILAYIFVSNLAHFQNIITHYTFYSGHPHVAILFANGVLKVLNFTTVNH